MRAGVYPIEATLAALSKLTPEILQTFVDQTLFESARVEALLLGNVATETARAMAQHFQDTLAARGSRALEAAEMEHYRLVAIPRGEPVAVHMDGRNPEEQNSAHITVFQMHEQGSSRCSALTDLTDQLMHRYLKTSYNRKRITVPLHLAIRLLRHCSTELALNIVAVGHHFWVLEVCLLGI